MEKMVKRSEIKCLTCMNCNSDSIFAQNKCMMDPDGRHCMKAFNDVKACNYGDWYKKRTIFNGRMTKPEFLVLGMIIGVVIGLAITHTAYIVTGVGEQIVKGIGNANQAGGK